MNELLGPIEAYYSDKLSSHGAVAEGVDWNGADGQVLRLEQLSRIIDLPRDFLVNDLGCGYGALLEVLRPRYGAFSYTGIDISPSMIQSAQQRYGSMANVVFAVGSAPLGVADFGVASGIFNVRLNHIDQEWLAHIHATLDILDQTSSRGFAFNCLTSYSDPERMRPDLYYADACALFDHCKRHYSRNVSLLHDYGLYEFTMLVRKS